MLFEALLILGMYSAYKCYQLYQKSKRYAEKGKRKARKHCLKGNRKLSIVGSEDLREGPTHRSPHSPHRVIATKNPDIATPYDSFR